MKRVKLLSLLLASTMALTAVGCTAKEESEGATGKAKDGVFQGKGSGYGGELTLEVEIEGDAIKDIKLVEEHETAPGEPEVEDCAAAAQRPHHRPCGAPQDRLQQPHRHHGRRPLLHSGGHGWRKHRHSRVQC